MALSGPLACTSAIEVEIEVESMAVPREAERDSWSDGWHMSESNLSQG